MSAAVQMVWAVSAQRYDMIILTKKDNRTSNYDLNDNINRENRNSCNKLLWKHDKNVDNGGIN